MCKSSQKVYVAKTLCLVLYLLQVVVAMTKNLGFSGELKSYFRHILPQCFDTVQSLKPAYDELLCDELKASRKELEKVEPPKPDEVLEKFVTRLKSYLKYDVFDCLVFDTISFDSDQKELQAEFAEIEGSFGHLEIPVLTLAKYRFYNMTEASRFMKCYSKMNLLGHKLVYTVVELRVSALAMLNLYGILDLSIVRYRNKIKRIRDHLCLSVKEFDDLFAPSLMIKIMFNDQVRQIKKVLKVLENHASKSLKYIAHVTDKKY